MSPAAVECGKAGRTRADVEIQDLTPKTFLDGTKTGAAFQSRAVKDRGPQATRRVASHSTPVSLEGVAQQLPSYSA